VRRAAAVRLEPFSLVNAPPEEWPELAWQSGNIFATWDWLSTWWIHFGDGRPLLTTAWRAADGRLLAILPLFLWSSRPLRVLRFLGHGPSDQLGPIYAPKDRTEAARALRHALAQMPQWDVFVGEQLPSDEHWRSQLRGCILSREGSPVLRAHGLSWDGYLASRSANLRQQVRRLERNLARKHELRYRLADDPLRLEDDLDTFFALHRARWQACESRFARLEAFHRDFAARALQRGWLRFWFLELDGYPCASWYGFRFAGVESYYQAARDPRWEKASIGFVLLAHSIRAALEDGLCEYRFLRGDEPFKYRFADLDPGLETIGLARGVAGVAALAGARALGRRGPFAALRRRLTE
jgi:CelD/BcsL family acetyltransferase involved in cellulose biosynthesis